MGGKKTESCGRCAMSSVVDVTQSDGDETDSRNPFDEGAIEIDDETLRRMSPGAWVSRISTRLDDAVNRLVYDR